jgi:membrane-bound lytic murein transglycosylase A
MADLARLTRGRLALLLVLAAVAGAALALGGAQIVRSFVQSGRARREAAAAPVPDRLALDRADFADLPGWQDDDLAAALPAFLRSCRRIEARRDDAGIGGMGGSGLFGTVADWRPACAAAARVPAGKPLTDGAAARAFFESEFTPFAATNHGRAPGLFTGYYEPTLYGSRRRGGRFTVPLLARPPDLVTVDLGRFRPDWKGRRIAGRVVAGALEPFPDRAAIDAGALAGRHLEIVWVDDPVDAFFLEIQGSGRVELAEGGVLRLGFAAQNGWPYTPIGRELVARGALKRDEVSLQSIRRWLADHPREAPGVMAKNASYVFFEREEGEGPVGTEGVVLTPGRSLAVDTAFLPLGIPLWIAGTVPSPAAAAPDRPLRRLLVAQDTGGAIRGPVRGDVFWGHGEEAAAVAGRMKNPGRLWVLLPKALAARLAPRV